MSEKIDVDKLRIKDVCSYCDGVGCPDCEQTGREYRELLPAERALLDSWREKARAWDIFEEHHNPDDIKSLYTAQTVRLNMQTTLKHARSEREEEKKDGR